MNDNIPTVFVIDDDPPVLKSVSRLLRAVGFTVATFGSSRAFLEGYEPANPGCLLLDVNMPDMNGLELQRALADKGGEMPIVFLTGHGDIPMSVKAMRQGALDFLTKPADEAALVCAIQAALEQARSTLAARQERADIRGRLETLTPREREVLEHVVSGKLNKQIAADLGTVEKTIKVHRARVMEKMRVESLAELVRLAEHVGVALHPTER
jgi:FixJ family two-component response regulator